MIRRWLKKIFPNQRYQHFCILLTKFTESSLASCTDLRSAEPGGYLIDNIVKLYSRHLRGHIPLAAISDSQISGKYHIFTTFLWPKLEACKSPNAFREMASSCKDVKLDQTTHYFSLCMESPQVDKF